MYLNSSFIKKIFVILCLMLTIACNGRKGAKSLINDSTSVGSAKELSKQIEQDASNPELYYQRSVVYFNEKYLDRSLIDINQAIDYDKQNPLYHYFKGRVLYAMNQTLKSSDAYEEAIKLKPDYTEAKLKVAELYFVVKEHQRSLKYLNSVIEEEPANATAYFFKGMNLKEMKDTLKAVDEFQHAFEYDKNFYDAAMQLGLIYASKNDKLALEYYTAAIRIDGKNDEAYFGRGVFYQTNKKYKEALDDYKKVVTINPLNDNAYYNVGYINFETKHFDEAIKNWNTCIQMNNNNIKAYYMRGLVHEIRNEKEDARINYEYALQLDPNFEQAKVGLKRIK